ncbi:MAG: hypothetical protein M9886_12975 [Candidatus Nanopelagicales bacterium]|nr:hypothetical protein [Candidatus Nanopelagicales bacterium]
MSTGSGSEEFDGLKHAIESNIQLRREIEDLLRLNVETYNPSDRGIRFITGSIGEWLLALALYAAGVVSLPDGHNADAHDLRAFVRDAQSNLWSVKTSYSLRAKEFTLSNGQGGVGRGFSVPTVFLSPEIGGVVYIDPVRHPSILDHVKAKGGETKIRKSAVVDFAHQHPECLIKIEVPVNPETAKRDPGFEAVKQLVEAGNFPRLRLMFDDVQVATSSHSVVSEIQQLVSMKDQLTPEQFDSALQAITGGVPRG